jgi:hypothetical protein
MPNQKIDFIIKLRDFAAADGRGFPDEYGHADYQPSRGQTVLVAAIADYLTRPEVVCDTHTNWFAYLGKHLVDAFAEFRDGPRWADMRDRYKATGAGAIPDLLDAYAGGSDRQLVTYDLARLMPLLAAQPWLRADLECRFGAQSMVIDHAWRRFVRVAYRKLMARIKEERHRGNAGTFGSTDLLTYAMAGRVMFTFRRDEVGGGDDGPNMTFVADDGDPHGHRSGPNWPGAPYHVCVAMIDEVTDHWDIDKLTRSDTTGLG